MELPIVYIFYEGVNQLSIVKKHPDLTKFDYIHVGRISTEVSGLELINEVHGTWIHKESKDDNSLFRLSRIIPYIFST